MKKANPIALLGITFILMLLAGILVSELNTHLWWTLLSLLAVFTVIVLIIPSREQRLKKLSEKKWKQRIKTG